MGTLAAIAAIMLTLENKNFFGNQGQGYLLTAIASVLIGGTSIFGGRATIVGTVFGCFIILMIEPALVADRPDRRLGPHRPGPRLPDLDHLLPLRRRAAAARAASSRAWGSDANSAARSADRSGAPAKTPARRTRDGELNKGGTAS